jgi:hypothetical protein
MPQTHPARLLASWAAGCSSHPPCQVYSEPLCRRHYSSLLSTPALFRVLAHAGAIALAFLTAYATGGFWVKIGSTVEQPLVHYSGDALAIFEVGPGRHRLSLT